MFRVLCRCSYDGTNFHGFQRQKHLRSVQQEIEDVLEIIHKRPVKIYAASRTDAGVHALDQVFHFDTELRMKEYNILNALNSRLPKDIYINECMFVDKQFYSRFSCRGKTYRYLIDLGKYNPLLKNYRYFPPKPDLIDVDKIIAATNVFIGTHDFKSFTKNKHTTNTVRTISDFEVIKQDDLLTFVITGNGFLHHMVRIIVAMLLEVGRGKCSKEDLKAILAARNRLLAPKLVPAHGLYLVETYY